jgi:hypothetical protein
MSLAAVAPRGDRILDFSGVVEVLTSMGVQRRDGRPLDTKTVRSWADNNKLPFFKGPDGARRISESTLRLYWTRTQQEAAKQFDSAKAAARSTGARRAAAGSR